ncbi:MAG: stage IV sporulation protein B [Erysipelotrichaceae bacterium]|nr:stage IV sporulation protein B [Erysipelotrichaceae bacterium]
MLKRFCCFFFALLLSFIHLSAAPRVLYVSGQTILIDAQYEGVLVSGSFEFSCNDQQIKSHPNDSVQITDLIITADNHPVRSNSDLNHIIASQKITSSSVDVVVKRNNERKNAKLYLYYDDEKNTFKTGFYVKDHISGIGTITYYDPQNHTYGALGHEITEKTTNDTADIHQGTIELGTVIEVEPSVLNQPGQKASKSASNPIGNILINNSFGLFGKYTQLTSYQIMEIGLQSNIQLGSASILTVIDGTEVQEYEIQITKLHRQDFPDVKGIELVITDKRLLQKSGGIIQGMSGSPIIQNGKIVGALTHMIPSNPHKGYGIYIEWMLKQSDLI